MQHDDGSLLGEGAAAVMVERRLWQPRFWPTIQMKTGFGELRTGRIGSCSDPENEVAANVILGTPEFRSRVLRGLHFGKLQRAVIDRP